MEPKIRFKGFEGEWKETIWGNHIVSTHTGTNLLGEVSNKGIPLLKMGNIQRGFFDLDKMEYLAANQNPPVNCIANYGDFFYNTRNTLELVGKGATWMKKDGIYAFNSNIAICKLDGIDTFFFNYLYNTLHSIKQVQARAKGTTSVAAVYMRDLKSIELTLPHISEQQAIASYFTSLDSQISASTSRLTSLKQMKAASLQAMFPQEGETVPKIRFKGFEGEWKKVKFKDFGHVAMCKRIFKNQTTSEGDVPFYKIGTFGSEPDSYISQSLFEEYKKKYSFPNKGDILISAAGTIGRTVEYNGENCYYQDSNIVWLDHNNNITNGFLKQLYSIVKWSSLEGATIKRLYNSNILETTFYIPNINEQQAIASYFTSLDRQIFLQSQRLEKLKQIKSACLDKMFV